MYLLNKMFILRPRELKKNKTYLGNLIDRILDNFTINR